MKWVKGEGDRGIVHKSRGRPSNRRFADKVKERVIKLYRERYKGFGPTLACEKLFEMNGIKVKCYFSDYLYSKRGDFFRIE